MGGDERAETKEGQVYLSGMGSWQTAEACKQLRGNWEGEKGSAGQSFPCPRRASAKKINSFSNMQLQEMIDIERRIGELRIT